MSKVSRMAEKVAELFPTGAANRLGTYADRIENAVIEYHNAINDGVPERTAFNSFAQSMNSLARIAYRRGYQVEIVEIS